MLDFSPVYNREVSLVDFVRDFTPDDLRRLTNDMVDHMLTLIDGCTDADVVFEPEDPDAHDSAASTEDEVGLAWNLGHVVVHTTASAEEAAFLAAEMARGVQREGRSRAEVPWRTVTTMQQCINRLEESRRMRLATLDVWPDPPFLDNTIDLSERTRGLNAIGRFVLGLLHDDRHLGQMAEIVRQARAARND